MRAFLNLADVPRGDVVRLLDRARGLRAAPRGGLLDRRVLGTVFFNPSLRTRVSFASAMGHQGGTTIDLTVGGGVWKLESRDGVVMDGDRAEHIREAAPVLSEYCDILAVRSFAEGKDWALDETDPVINAFARYATVPLINMESAVWHPCQALADRLTLDDYEVPEDGVFLLTWAPHPRALPMAVPNSALLMAAQRGMRVRLLRPEGFALAPSVMRRARELASHSGGAVDETDDRPRAFEGAGAVYAKSWGSLEAYGNPEAERALRVKYADWTVTAEDMSRTDSAIFMHCLPVRRNVVVEDAVLDGPRSVVVHQAGNRLHGQKAVLCEMLGV